MLSIATRTTDDRVVGLAAALDRVIRRFYPKPDALPLHDVKFREQTTDD